MMLWNYVRFDFGKSYFRDVSVLQLIKEKLPVSISLGIWMTLLTYLISIPLGIRKAVHGRLAVRRLDVRRHHHRLRHSGLSVRDPSDHPVRRRLVLDIFPLRGLTSDNWAQIPWWQKILDYFWHLTLPIISMALARLRHHDAADQELVSGRVAQAICADRAREGLHRASGALRAHFPQRHADRHRRLSGRLRQRLLRRLAADRDTSSRSTGSGCLSFESVLNRDYPVVFANLYIFALVGLVVRPDLRPHLYVGRSAHRFRDAGGVRWTARNASKDGDGRGAHDADRRSLDDRAGGRDLRCRRSIGGAGRISSPTGAATGRCGFSSFCSSSRCLPSSSPTTSRSWSLTTASLIFRWSITYPESDVRRRLRDRRGLSRSVSAEADCGQGRLMILAADPLFLRHAQSRPADAGAVAADVDADRGAVRAGGRAQGPPRAAATSNTIGSAPTTRAATWWRA